MNRETNPGEGDVEVYNLLVIGIGGVGGYVGGSLAALGASDAQLRVHFLARGAHLEAIRRDGLTVIHGDGRTDPRIDVGMERRIHARPASASDRPGDLGLMDAILVCTKFYDLEQAVASLAPCLKAETLLLPLLNGVSAGESMRRWLPGHEILDGCIYIVSRLTGPGMVTVAGDRQRLDIGRVGVPIDQHPGARRLLSWMERAGLDVRYHERIDQIAWRKYLFISATATATAFFDAPVGAILSDPERMGVWTQLVGEALAVARAEGVDLPAGIQDEIAGMLRAMPPDSTATLHSDMRQGRPSTELDLFTLEVIRKADRHGLLTPTFDRLHAALAASMPRPHP
jgi:2-dehydropantoate 2-reductase